MRVAWAAWVQWLLGLAKAALFVTIAVILIQQVYFGPTRLAAARPDAVLPDGRWTPDFPILVVNAKPPGLPVSTDVPRTVYRLMDLSPQGAKGQPSVLYVPFRRAGGLESLPPLPGLFQ